MKAIIVGGGIGGLTTALMLRARGIECELYEKSDTIRELGVGINTLPHAIRELAGLGLLDKLDAAAIRTFELFYLTRHGQQVWHQYWDTHLTYNRSYYARLNYVHENPCRHGLVPVASSYPWCSAAWLERTATPAFVKTLSGFKTDRISIHDDFEVIWERE